jgi:hypothetical protein
VENDDVEVRETNFDSADCGENPRRRHCSITESNSGTSVEFAVRVLFRDCEGKGREDSSNCMHFVHTFDDKEREDEDEEEEVEERGDVVVVVVEDDDHDGTSNGDDGPGVSKGTKGSARRVRHEPNTVNHCTRCEAVAVKSGECDG